MDLAGNAVHREPVSTPNPLLTGKNTGKFTKADKLGIDSGQNQPMTRAFDANPKDRNRELKNSEIFSETGNLLGSRNGACLSAIVTLGMG